MVGIAGYRYYCNDKNVESQRTNNAKCNETIKFVVKIVTIRYDVTIFLFNSDKLPRSAPDDDRAAQSARSFRFGRFFGYRLHGHPAGQRVGDRVHDFLCLFFATIFKDVGGEIEADMDRSSKFGHFPLPLS